VIILDTPASETNADAQTIATRAGGALVIARSNCTPMRAVRAMSAQLVGTGVTIMGSVINTI